jgi:hypothetical protein
MPQGTRGVENILCVRHEPMLVIDISQRPTGEVEFFAVHLDDDGTVTKEAVRPDESLDADKFYATAVEYAVAEVINLEVAARDLPGIAYGTESVCGGVIQ